jgi:DHA1 family bicyclomycin/chloramphenicol resistance-like MFS transporter
MKADPHSIKMITILAALVSIGQISTSMYLPALPTIVDEFNTTAGTVQLTVSIYLLGWAGSILFIGPLSDRFGRKPIIIFGLLLHIGTCIACVYISSIEGFFSLRLFQGIGGAITSVLGRTIVRDIFEGEYAAKMLSFVGALMAIAQGVAPILGGYLHLFLGWQSIFIFLGFFGLCLLIVVLFFMEESLKSIYISRKKLTEIFQNYPQLLKHNHFMGFVICASSCAAGNFAYVSGASFVFLETFNISEESFGYYFAITVFGFIVGTALSGFYSTKFGIRKLIHLGVTLCFISGVLMVSMAWANLGGVYMIVVPQIFYYIGVGIVSPQCTAGALSPFPQMAGAASSLLGFTILLVGSLVGALVGQTFDGTQLPMALIIALCGLLGLVSYRVFINKE